VIKNTNGQVDQEVPEKNALQARRRADQPQAVPADVKPGGHGREHAGTAEVFRRPIGNERREHRQHDLDARIVDPTPHSQHEPTDADAPEDFAGDDRCEHAGGLAPGKYAEAHGCHREAIENQCARIIRKTLTLEYHDEPPRQLHAARDRQWRYGVGRGNDGSQQEADGPGETQQPMGHRGGRGSREQDATHSQQRNRPQIESELAPAHRHRRRINDRRQHEQQDEFRRELDGRQPREQRQNHAGEHQQYCRRNLEPFRHERNGGNHDQQ
jgi:hypothetical protein